MARNAKTEGPHLVDLHVGRRVEGRRREMGLTQSELAKALAITFQQVQKYEKGTNRVSASRLWEMGHFLKVEPAYFFRGLTGAQPGMAESDTVSFESDFPVSKHASDIARLAPRLSASQQKIVLALVRELTGGQADAK